jgi:hypothetical protein
MEASKTTGPSLHTAVMVSRGGGSGLHTPLTTVTRTNLAPEVLVPRDTSRIREDLEEPATELIVTVKVNLFLCGVGWGWGVSNPLCLSSLALHFSDYSF